MYARHVDERSFSCIADNLLALLQSLLKIILAFQQRTSKFIGLNDTFSSSFIVVIDSCEIVTLRVRQTRVRGFLEKKSFEQNNIHRENLIELL